MQLPGNPQDGLKKISDEMKQKFDEAGMNKVEEFMDTLDEVKGMAEKGPTKILDEMKGQFEKFKAKIQEFLDNPASLAPGSGGLAACAAWYGGAVVEKIKVIGKDAEDMMGKLKEMGTQIMEPMKKLSEVLESAMSELEATIKQLGKLPKELSNMVSNISGPEDVAKLDVAPMKKCLDTSGISGPLDAMAGLKGPLKSAINAVKEGVENVMEFLENLPDKITACFDVPQPLCWLQSTLMSNAPPAMTQLLDMVKELKRIDLSPVQGMLGKVAGAICDMDPAQVTEPVKKFAASATGNIEDLEKLVTGAKAAADAAAAAGAANAAANAVAGAVPGGVPGTGGGSPLSGLMKFF